jgi:hypothetical protein
MFDTPLGRDDTQDAEDFFWGGVVYNNHHNDVVMLQERPRRLSWDLDKEDEWLLDNHWNIKGCEITITALSCTHLYINKRRVVG